LKVTYYRNLETIEFEIKAQGEIECRYGVENTWIVRYGGGR
jgi:hypothetical protein